MLDSDSAPNVHLDAETLCKFGQGLLAAEEAVAVEEHLSTCDVCCRRLEAIPTDSFIRRLRNARNRAGLTQIDVDGRFRAAGETLGDLAEHPRYRVIRLLGQGGMGDVYLAEHRRMGRMVALKVINPDFLHSASALVRFQMEAKAAAKLDHPNIVAAYDADQAGNLHFLVMEYVDGRNLADHLREKGPLPVAEACDIISQAAHGLQHAHQRGMVHRDIKPHNLMMTHSGQVKVLDFGLARFAIEPLDATSGEETEDKSQSSDDAPWSSKSRASCAMPGQWQSLTAAGAVMGTADYIAPEQARDAHVADGRSDIYSLGCTLYHLLSGQPPFPGGTAHEKLLLHTTDTPLRLCVLRPEIPDGLAQAVAKMMAKRPADRYQTSAEVPIALRPFTPRADSVRKLRRAWLAIAALLLCAGLAAAMAGAHYLHADGEETVRASRENDPLHQTKVGEVRRWRGHHSPVFRIVVAPDGRSAWSIADDFRRWDVATGETVQLVETPIWHGELLPTLDGKQFLTMDRPGGVIRLYDVATMKHVRAFERGHAHFWQAAWFPNGRLLTDGDDGSTRIWDVSAGVPIHEFRGQAGIACVAVGQDGSQFLTGYEADRKIRVWDLITKTMRFEIADQVCHPNSAHFVLGGKAILTCGQDSSIRLFDTQTGELMRTFSTPKRSVPWARIALFKDGRHFISADAHEFLRLWRIDTEQALYTARTELGGAASLAVTPDGRQALIGTFDGQIVQWQLPELPEPEATDTSGAVSPAAKARREIAAPIPVPAVKLVETPFKVEAPGGFPAYNPDGTLLAGCSGRDVTIFDAKTGRKLQLLTGHTDRVQLVSFSGNGRLLASGSHDRMIRLWDVATGTHVCTLEGHTQTVLGLAFSPDGTNLASTDEAGNVRLWNVKDGILKHDLGNFSSLGFVVAFHPNGKFLVGGAWAGEFRVWDTDGILLMRDRLPGQSLVGANFSPDGRLLALGTSSLIVVYDANTFREVWREPAPAGGFLRFTPDSSQLLAANLRQDTPALRPVLRLDAATGLRLGGFYLPAGKTIWVHPSLSPNGKILAAQYFGASAITFYDIETGAPRLSDDGLLLGEHNSFRPNGGEDPPPLPQQIASDFVEAHDISLEALTAWLRKIKVRGLAPTTISVRPGTDEPRFSAVAMTNKMWGAWHFYSDLEPEHESALLHKMEGLGYRPTIRTVYSVPEAREIQVSMPIQGAWSTWQGTREFIEDHVRQERPAGLRPVALSFGGAPGKEKWTIISVQTHGTRDSELHFNLSSDELILLATKERKRGWMLGHVCSLAHNGELRFAAVTSDNPKNAMDWELGPSRTTAEYETAVEEHRQKGLCPVAIAPFTVEQTPRYTVLWRRFRKPADPAK